MSMENKMEDKMAGKRKEDTKGYREKIDTAAALLSEADAIVVGIGSGMSASGGLNYVDPALAKKWFPEYVALGFRSLAEIQSVLWIMTPDNVLSYWGYWCRHIYHIRYETGLLEPYRRLAELLRNKNYFVCTTNADGQIQKAGFDESRIFAPQGNYASFQCCRPCRRDEVYPNREMIERMVGSINEKYKISPDTVPRCPRCGDYLIPNLRCDDRFVELPNMKNLQDYEGFLDRNVEKKLVLLELGVGFNTPGIIRYPFNRLAGEYPDVWLIRINKGCADGPAKARDRFIGVDGDVNQALIDLAEAGFEGG